MPQERLPHIFLINPAERTDYTSRSSFGSGANIPHRNRRQHSQTLIRKFQSIWAAEQENRTQRTVLTLPTRHGMYLEFRSQAGHDLITKSLDDMRSKNGARLLNIRTVGEEDAEETIATVYIPSGKENHFLKKIEKYATKIDKRSNKPMNFKLVNSIEDVRLAMLESFWQDPIELMPDTTAKWCEIWLRTGITAEQSREVVESFTALCRELRIEIQEDNLFFPERAVVLVKANKEALANLKDSSDNIAEFRLAKETARFWVELPPSEQAQWVEELQSRLRVNQDANVAVTILDTGVNNGHELLSSVLTDDDCHSHKEGWGTEDHNGHGTNMAGLAVYGDLQKQLDHSGPIEINHKLESAKILPPQGDNDPKEWGSITQQAISRVEIKNPDILHIGCMAVTGDFETDWGRPSSWSAAIDAMTSGYPDDPQRLFIVSAGNIEDKEDFNAYPDSNQAASVKNPAQSWNALTVGAYTTKDQITDPDYQDHEILAQSGGLSPYSTTSWSWDRKKWPYKPEILLEGGNLSKSPDGFVGNLADLDLLTTHHKITEGQFSTFQGTSSATAQAACMAAQIQTAYPNAWPETVRALMVHNARWTETMKQQFNINNNSSKSDIANMLRTCGYGVPNLNKAMSCARNSLTLIAQEYIQPFDKKHSGGYCTKDMHIHELPWPKQVLRDLAETQVELRVTLSYFVEPGVGEIGWKDRYRYASHALRFDVNSPTESQRDFKARLNTAARDEDYDRDTAPSSGSDRWLIGSQNRKLGSIHSDVWKSTAADIAECNLIGIYPVIGWWRERQHLNRWNRRTRYSLIVSLDTPEQSIDLYTPVAIQLQIPIPT